MIFRRSIVSELTSTASAVFTVLFSILFSVGLVRILGQAAGGRVDNQAVFELVALTALVWLPIILTLTLFVSVLMTLNARLPRFRDGRVVYLRPQPDGLDRAALCVADCCADCVACIVRDAVVELADRRDARAVREAR